METEEKKIEVFLNHLWDPRPVEQKFVFSYFAENALFSSPFGNKIGLESMLAIHQSWCTAFPDKVISRYAIEHYPNTIITHWECQATHLGIFREVEATHKKIQYEGEAVFLFERGKVNRYFCKVDLLGIFNQLGYQLKPEECFGGEQVDHAKLIIEKIQQSLPVGLTKREVECLSLYLMGMSARNIGNIFFVSSRTVESHIQNAFQKLQLSSKIQCLEQMIQLDLLHLWQALGKEFLHKNP